jgi:hypothetical protein
MNNSAHPHDLDRVTASATAAAAAKGREKFILAKIPRDTKSRRA